jgi:hypothetical protein
MIQAPRRRALFYPRPVLFDPGGDRLVVALDRAPRRALSAPAQPLAQDRPGLGLGVPHPAHRLDHLGHPRQRPHLGREAVRPRALDQRGLHLRQLILGQLAQPPGPIRAGQRGAAALLPGPVPARRRLRRHSQLVDHIDLPLAPPEHVRRSHPAVLQRLQVAPRAHPSAGTRPLRSRRRCHTRIVLPGRANLVQRLTVLPKHL